MGVRKFQPIVEMQKKKNVGKKEKESTKNEGKNRHEQRQIGDLLLTPEGQHIISSLLPAFPYNFRTNAPCNCTVSSSSSASSPVLQAPLSMIPIAFPSTAAELQQSATDIGAATLGRKGPQPPQP